MPANTNPRNLRELEVLASIIDLVASGRHGEAADALTQRMIAVRMAIEDNSWSKAAFVELAPHDTSIMIPRNLRQAALKEADAFKKLQASTSSASDSPKPKPIFELPVGDPHPQYWNNKGEIAKGKKVKGGKAKGKGKKW